MTFENWVEVFTAIEPIASRYGFSIHKGWKYLINKEVGLTLKIRVSKNSKNQDMIEIEPANGTQSKAKSQWWCSRLDVFLQISISSQFEDWIRECIGLPSLAERDRQLSEIAAEIERCDHALVLSELNPIADPGKVQEIKEYKSRLYGEIDRIDPIDPSDWSDEDLLIELGVLPSRMEAPQEIQQDALIAYLSALDTPTLEAMSGLDWAAFDHDPSVIEITRVAIASELGKRIIPSGGRPVYHPQIPQIEPEAINVEAVEIKRWAGPRQAVYRDIFGQIASIEMIDKPKKPKNTTNPNQLGLF